MTTAERVHTVIVLLGTVVMLVLGILVGRGVAGVCALTALLASAAVLLRRSRLLVETQHDRLVVRNWFRNHTLGVLDIECFSVRAPKASAARSGFGPTVRVTLRDGRAVDLQATTQKAGPPDADLEQRARADRDRLTAWLTERPQTGRPT